MKIEDVKTYINKNKDKFPISYEELVYIANDEITTAGKIVNSEKYKDDTYSIYKLYKPITRF